MLERGAYNEMLDHYYILSGPLPPELPAIYRLCRAFDKHEQRAIDSVLAKFFSQSSDGWHNKRADEEIAKDSTYIAGQRAKSALGVAARQHTPKQARKNNGEDQQPPVEFDRFWSAYPRKVAKAAAQRAWKKIKNVHISAILDSLAEQAPQWTDPQFIPHPATWLNQARWNDEQPVVEPLGRCAYCADPAVKRTNGIEHCGSAHHLDLAIAGKR